VRQQAFEWTPLTQLPLVPGLGSSMSKRKCSATHLHSRPGSSRSAARLHGTAPHPDPTAGTFESWGRWAGAGGWGWAAG